MAETWRPIRTAPKDGTPLLLYSPGTPGNVPHGLIWVSGGWRELGGWRGEYGREEPTHWMPLPEPPRGP